MQGKLVPAAWGSWVLLAPAQSYGHEGLLVPTLMASCLAELPGQHLLSLTRALRHQVRPTEDPVQLKT